MKNDIQDLKIPSTHKGQAIYSKNVLKIYDFWVLGISNKYFWKCNTNILKEQFKMFTSNNHLDVGVGTGYFLDKCLKDEERKISLFDLNENSLNTTAQRIKRFKPKKYKVDILKPINIDCDNFDSISINFLLHCLPGNLTEKSVLFKNLNSYLNQNGIIFGSTILGQDIRKNYFAKKLMNVYNKKGIFSNQNDNLNDLKIELEKHFDEVNIKLEGCVALFNAKKKKES